jgi:hypothetical protein
LENLTYKTKWDRQKSVYEEEESEIGDDLVLAIALPVWFGEMKSPSGIKRRKSYVAPMTSPFQRNY